MPPGVGPDTEQLRSLQDHYDAGRFLDAARACAALAPPAEWTGTGARILAGRLLRHCGAQQDGHRQLLRAWRHDPRDWQARYFVLWLVEERRGTVAAGERLLAWGNPPERPEPLASDFGILRARFASRLRDFDRADRLFAATRSTAVDRAWWWTEYGEHLERCDRYAESLAAAEEGLAQFPWRWSLVLRAAGVLQLLGRDDDAVRLLAEALPRTQSAHIPVQLAVLLLELGRPAEALPALDEAEARMPFANGAARHWLASQRAQAHHAAGDLDAALAQAEAAGPGFWEAFASRARDPASPRRRVELPVGFVRQHHLTCVPATLTTLARYWGRPAEHLGVAEAICYDGTPSHAERGWAEGQGWVAREFRVTWDAARALLDRGVPFCLTTVQPGNAHEQAVVGYDELRGSLLVRDPYHRNRFEVLAGPGLESQRASGPRGMAMVPAEQAALLEGVVLPESALYDAHHALLAALACHDRQRAEAALAALEAAAPGHRLALQGRRALAAHDGNPAAVLAAVEGLLALFPEDVNLHLAKLACLCDLERREARLAHLESACRGRDAHPFLWRELAWELSADARRQPDQERWLRRYRRAVGDDPRATWILAGLRWEQGRFDEAVELYRTASCLDDKAEAFAVAYFNAARGRGRTAEALAWLTRRFEASGTRSAQPARTLVWAHRELDANLAALAVLERALELRPDDALLRLHASDVHLECGDPARAEQLAESVAGGVPPGALARSRANRARKAGDTGAERAGWAAVLEAEPLAMDALSSMARVLGEAEGRASALTFLSGRVALFPHHLPTRQLQVEWLREEGGEAREAGVRALLAVDPANAWGWRELALVLESRGDPAAAEEAASTAEALEPGSPVVPNVRGLCALRRGDREGAMAAFRESLARSVDDAFAMRRLVDCAVDRAGLREALQFIRGELVRQTVREHALQQFAELARPVLEPWELLQTLHEAHAARPDLWGAWSALVGGLVAAGRPDEALPVAEEAVRRFPLKARLWIDLGRVHHARLDPEAELRALEQVRVICPEWGFAMRELAQALRNAGRPEEALRVMETAVRRSPLDAFNRGWLGQALERAGDNGAALVQFRECVMLEPGATWAWEGVARVGAATGQPDLALALARELARRRPGEPRSWLILARVLPEESVDERLEALARIDALSPRLPELWLVRAEVLASAGRLDEAVSACTPDVFKGAIPPELRAKAAWVRSLRGDLPGACMSMHEALRDDPTLDWGWRLLADWHFRREQWSDAAEAAEALGRLSPGDPVPLGYAAEVRSRAGDREGARQLLEKAFALDAGYAYAGWKIHELQVGERDFAGARRTLARMRGHLPDPPLIAAGIAVELADPGPEGWLALLARLADSPVSDPGSAETAAKHLGRSPHAAEAEAWVRGRLASDRPCSPDLGALWVCLREAMGELDNNDVLESLPDGEVWRRALVRHCDALGDAAGRGDRAPHGFAALLERHGPRLGADTRLWGKAGYVLAARNDPAARAWLLAWRDHPEAEDWMLLNAVVTFQRGDLEAEADAVVDEMSRRHPDSAFTRRSTGWRAVRCLARGDAGPARAFLACPPATSQDPTEAGLREFLAVVMAGGRRRPSGVPASERALLGRMRRQWGDEPPMLRAWRSLAWGLVRATWDVRVLL